MVSNETPGYLTKIYSIAKKDFEIASIFLSDAYKYAPNDLHYDIHTAHRIIIELAQVMQDFINITENSGQPEEK